MNASHTLYLLTIALAMLAGVLGIGSWRDRENRTLRLLARLFALVACSTAAVAWTLRWTAAGHIPLFGTYESSLSLGLACLAVAAGWDARKPDLQATPAATLVSVLVLAQGFGYDSTAYALTISERSVVVDLHALLAWIAFGWFAAGLGLALKIILTPDSGERITRALSISLSIGFVLLTAMIASGSLYKFMLFGTPWSFDPIETMAFIAWVAYGTILHMDLLAGWTGKRLARWCVGVFIVLLLSYRAIIYFPAWSTYHIFDMDMRVHLVGNEAEE